MIEKSFSVLFYLKRSRSQKGNLRHIYARISVDTQRVEISLKLTWCVDNWSTISNRALGRTEKARQINAYLDSFQMKVLKARKYLIDNDKEVTASSVKNVLYGNTEDRKMVLEVFRKHNEEMEELVGREYAPGTLQRYKTSYDHTKAFIGWKYQKEDIELKKLNYEFISQYSFWLKTVRSCGHNTTVKYLTNFKKIVLSCVRKGWLSRDPFQGFKTAKKEVIREILTKDELKSLSEKKFAIERLDQVRDIFLFCCYTGLAYIDVKNLKRSQIILGMDNEKWIETKRKKTDTPVKVPMLPVALEIKEKYQDHPKCGQEGSVLPVLSNQKMNAYLKEIADLCGIQKDLTFHTARHTFATTVTLSNGVPIETVSKLLGHKSLKQTQHYAKILDVKISEDMLALKEKLGK